MDLSGKVYDALIQKYPKIMSISYVECPDGWYDIIEEAVEKLAKFENCVHIEQIKEKFGTLRIYVSYPYDYDDEVSEKWNKERQKTYDFVDSIITEAEFKAARTCVTCTKEVQIIQYPKKLKPSIYPLCKECFEEHRAFREKG